MPPSVADVLIAVFAVLLGCMALTVSLYAGRRGGNWLYFVCSIGAAAFVAGVVGQRVFPSPAAVGRLGSTAAATSAPGPWDAGVSIPVLGIRMTPVGEGGLLLAAVGLSLVLLFERVTDEPPASSVRLRPLDEDDSV